jgi:hypothetical protein
MKDVTIVLQGRVGKEQMELWKKNYKNWNVIVSTWEDVDFDFGGGIFSKWLPRKWKLVINKYPIIRGWKHANLDYQIITTLAGLNEVKTKWVIKARCDEYWSNLEKVVELMNQDENKIVSSSMYFRSKKYDSRKMKFHIGDKILGGTIDNLTLMFESTIHNLELNLWNTRNPEGQLGLGYIIAKDKSFDFDVFMDDYSQIRQEPGSEDITYNTFKFGLQKINNKVMELAVNNLDDKTRDWKKTEKEIEHLLNVVDEISNRIKDYNQPITKFDDMIYLKKWFTIIDINELQPYIATYSGGSDKTRKWFRDDFNHKDQQCLTTL